MSEARLKGYVKASDN